MRRFVTIALALAAATSIGCATYSQDLERAKTHYEANQYEAALALFRVLELDFDSLPARPSRRSTRTCAA